MAWIRHRTDNTMWKVAVLMVLPVILVHCPAEMMITSTVCSNPNDQCNYFNLTCPSQNLIQLSEATYKIKGTGWTNGTANSADCVIDGCVISHKSCCPVNDNYEDKGYSPDHLYSLLGQCSGKDACQPKAEYFPTNSGGSISCSVSYTCVPETIISNFCSRSSVLNEGVHLLFENTTTLYDTETLKTCWCTINSTDSYTLQARDLRFQNATGHCFETNKLRVNWTISDDTILTCSEKLNISLLHATYNVSGPIEFEMSFDPRNKPQMVWIEATGNSISSVISAECFDVDKLPTLEDSTDLPTNVSLTTSSRLTVTTAKTNTITSTQSTYITQVNNTNSTSPTLTTTLARTSLKTTTQTQATQTPNTTPINGSYVEHVIGKDSESFPVLAAVVPLVVLLLLSISVAGFIYRKRLLKSAKPKTVTYANDQTAIETDKGPVKTADNYIVLEPENTYTYIDHGDVQNNVSTIETKATKPVNRKAKQFKPTNPGYFTTKPEIIPLTTRVNNKQEPGQDHTYTESTDVADEKYSISTKVSAKYGVVGAQEIQTLQSNNHFVLEPQNTSEPTEVNKTLQNSEQIQSHNYFVLEPQNTPSSTSGSRKGKPKSETESVKANNHNYLELESPDTYSSINPDDVIVQTLPENEYNVLSLNGKPITRDPNYGTLNNAALTCKDIEDSGEYSHINKHRGQKEDMNEYSHTNFTK